MARVKPFRGIRPRPENASKVVSRSFDSYSRDEVNGILDSNADSFLHVIQPDHGVENKSPANSIELFEKCKNVFDKMFNQGIFEMDEKPAYYLYTQYIGRVSYTGIVGCASVADYDEGVIRIHEQTLVSREKVLRDYLSICDINADPVCFTYPRTGSLELLNEMVRQSPPMLDFEDDEGRKHQLWKIDDEGLVNRFSENLGGLESVYIADGHHRSASSVLLAHDRWSQNGKVTGEEPYNYFLSIFFSDDQLKIYEFNRVVKDLGDKSISQFLEELSVDFEVLFRETVSIKPEEPGHFGMYVGGSWYRLVYRNKKSTEVVTGLDVSILSDKILAPLLAIKDLRNDDRMGFVPGIKGVQELERLVDSGKYDIAFSLYPVSGEEFYAISDQGKTMPPKSTYILPKLLSGLLIYSLSEG